MLRDDGTLWLNLGDCYATGAGSVGEHPGGGEQGERWRGYRGERLANGRGDQPAVLRKKTRSTRDGTHAGKHTGISAMGPMTQPNRMPLPGLKPKDLVGLPWRVAFALQADGWYLRSDIIWSKPNPMPESVEDRPTKSHEYVFLLSKSEEYFYDAEAIREKDSGQDHPRSVLSGQPSLEPMNGLYSAHKGLRTTNGRDGLGRNKRSVWTISTQPYPEAHFATFPTKLITPMILAGTSEKGCCLSCGAPWERIVEHRDVNSRNERIQTVSAKSFAQEAGHLNGTSSDRLRHLDGKNYIHVRGATIGWQPTCRCVVREFLALRAEAPYGPLPNEWDLLAQALARTLPIPCTVLDPFAGSGTTLHVAKEFGRRSVGIELNTSYCELALQRTAQGVLGL